MTTSPSPFSTITSGFQVAYDSTSLSWLKACPKLYQYQMLNSWEPKSRGVHLVFGGLYAAALERYAHARASGDTHDASVLRMVRWALEASGERYADGVWTPWDPKLPDGTPHPDANVKNRYTLIRSLVWNADERQTSPFHTVIDHTGKPMVERSFSFEAFEVGGEPIALSGHLDEVVEAEGQTWIRDDKTSKNALGAGYFQQFTPNGQMSLYTVAGRVIFDQKVRGVLVKAAQITVGFTRFQTAQVPRPQAVLDEWMRDTQYWIGQARTFALTGHYPLNDKSCFLCAFKKVCAVSPSHREAHLQEDFVKRKPWNPLEARGDI